MTTVKQMLSDLRNWGLDKKYIKIRKADIEPVHTRCQAIKTMYKGYLKWDDIGSELNHWLDRPDVTLDVISNKLLKHKERAPGDIGKK